MAAAAEQAEPQTSSWDPVTQSYRGDDAPAPAPQAQSQGIPQQQASWDQATQQYRGNFAPPEQEPAGPTVAPEHKPHKLWELGKGFVGSSNRLLTLLTRAAGQSGEGLAGEGGISPEDAAASHQEFYKNFVEPEVENQKLYDLGPNPTFGEEMFHGLGATAGFIAQAVASGGAAGAGVTGALEGAVPGLVARGAGGATMATLPATANAVELGHQVMAETKDLKTAIHAAIASYLINAASFAVPMGVGGNMAVRMATAGATGEAVSEAGRVAQNATLPENMQTPFSARNALLNIASTAPFGILPHAPGGRVGGVEEEAPSGAIEQAERHAETEVAARGGDQLDQKVAAITTSAEVGAHHDAAAVQAARDAEAQLHAETMDMHRQQAMEADANDQKMIDVQKEEQARAQAEQAQAAEKEDAFARAEADQAARKSKDFTAAKNQAGEQEVEASKTAEVGAERGGANEPKPTVEEALPPETLAALQGLKARRMLEAARGTEEKPSTEETIAPDVKPLPEGQPEKGAKKNPAPGEALFPDAPVSPHMRGEAPAEEEEAPATNPPPVTAQTLAQRRQEALDAKLAAKVRNVEAPTAPPEAAKEEAQEAPSEPANAVPTPPEEAPASAKGPANRLAAIRAAAEKRRQQPVFVKEDKQYVARDADTGEEIQRFPDYDAAKAYKTENPEVDITHEPRLSLPQDKPTRPNDIATPKASPQESSDGQRTIFRRYEYGEGNELHTVEYPERGITQAKAAVVKQGLRGRGIGTSLLERGVQDAHERGQVFHSDKQVSAMQQGTYESLKERGYDVRENPSTTAANGEKTSKSDLKGVYEVHPKQQNLLRRPDSREPVAGRYTAEEAEQHLQPFKDAGHQLAVHDTPLEAIAKPDHPFKPADVTLLEQHPRAQGMYDPDSNTVHIFAGNIDSHKLLQQTALHEMAHRGVRTFLGPDYADTMRDIAENADSKVRGRMQDIAKQYGLDLRTERDRIAAADEYAAHLAENPEENPGAWQRIVRAVRSGLRRLGVVNEWTEDDVRHLLLSSDNHVRSRMAEEGRAYKGTRLSLPEDNSAEQFAEDDPRAVASKWGRTMEEQAKYNPGFARKALDTAKEGWDKTLNTRLAFVGLRNLPDFLNERTRQALSSVQDFVRVHDQMEGRRGRISETAGKIALDWSKWATKNKREAAKLGEVMHAATLGGVDPSKPYSERFSEEERNAEPAKEQAEQSRQSLHKRLSDMYDKDLDDKGRELFNTVRDYYSGHRADVLRALEARINESGADEKTKQQTMAELRKKFESGRVEGPYFPLARFGKHWARALDKDGNTMAFSRFESKAQRKAWEAEAKARGFDTQRGEQTDEKSLMERIDPDFVKTITQAAKDISPEFADEIWQHYLKAMPEMSMRKHFIHRQGRLGFTMDAMRAFNYNSFHGAHQLARLEYGNRLDSTMSRIREQSDAMQNDDNVNETDRTYAASLTREMQKRLDWIKNPRASALASAVTKFGFGWYLGWAPATAFRISSQNMMLAQPMLAKYHGQLGATKELSRAVAQWVKNRGSDGLINALRGEERDAMENAKDQGVFSNTWAQTLASGGEGETSMTPYVAAYNRAAAYLFNAMEHKNRMTTYLAAYRLGRMNDMSHNQAMEHATDLTWDSHFDYTNANRPRVLQNDFAKVAFLFKQYSWGVTYRLAREFRDMTRMDGGITPENRVQATKAFAGLLGRGMMFSGVTGLPLYWAAKVAMDYAFGDDDKPYDSEAAMKASLTESYGQTVADAITDGPASAITGAALHRGASYDDLWYKPPSRDESAMEYWTDAMGQFAGAIPSIGSNFISGAHMAMNGNIERGAEHFLPPVAAGLAKAIRYSSEGVTNLRGEQLLNPEDLNAWDLALQGVGLSPQKVADTYSRNNAIMNVRDEIEKRKQYLTGKLAVALSNGNPTEVGEAQTAVDHFNAANPNYQIGTKSVVGSMRSTQKREAGTAQGVYLPQGLQNLQQEY